MPGNELRYSRFQYRRFASPGENDGYSATRPKANASPVDARIMDSLTAVSPFVIILLIHILPGCPMLLTPYLIINVGNGITYIPM